jgi:hypothetical protein
MALHFTPEQIYAEAVRIGLVRDAEPLPDKLRARAAASLAAAQHAARVAAAAVTGPQVARIVTVRPGRGPLVDGKPFPWAVTDDTVQVEVRADGSGFVRLTLPALQVRVDADTDSPDESEPRA